MAQSPSPSPTPNIVQPTPATFVPATRVLVSISEQKLAVVVNNKVSRVYKISTSRYGEGDSLGSCRTPLGRLAVATKIGALAPAGGVFRKRQFTGEILSANAPGRDPIVSRIIWLRGSEEANHNAFHRCIYIHGTPQEDFLGRKASFGCVRMRSSDVIEVFNWVQVGTEVSIIDKPITQGLKEELDAEKLLAKNAVRPESVAVH
ncbi:MAG: L,D-transpeptidase [Verrucomicrobia bacterium]|nr:L,D-transpeptidase [Verrucomicrobiota bacterium]